MDLHFLAVVHGSDNRLFRKIHNSQGGSAGQQIPVALGYHPWLFKRPPNAPDQERAEISALKISSAPVFWIWLLDAHERAKRKEMTISPLHFLSQHQTMQRTDLA